MKKAELGIEERLTYKRSMVILVPDNMDEDRLNDILDKVQIQADSTGDIPYLLKKHGIETETYPDENFRSPWDSEVEIEDLDLMEQENES